MAKDIKYENDYFAVVDFDGWLGVEPKNENVIVVPYTVNNYGIMDKIGVNYENNPLRDGGYSYTAVTGDVDDSDSTSFDAAKRELLEETGYDVTDDTKWEYMGQLTTSKLLKEEQPCYMVNITDMEPQEKEGDGSDFEANSKFEMVTLNRAMKFTDAYILSMIMKYFVTKYSKVFNIQQKDLK